MFLFHIMPLRVAWHDTMVILYSCGHKRTSDYKRTLLFGPCLTSKFSVTLWENTFGYKHTPKIRQTRIYKCCAYERKNTVVLRGNGNHHQCSS